MIKYQDNSMWARIKRRIGIRDGYLICNDCERDFYNLHPAEVCEGCWCFFNESGP